MTTISDTLNHLLRTVLAGNGLEASASPSNADAVPEVAEEPASGALQAAAEEIASKRAHELDREEQDPVASPDVSPLEVSAETIETLNLGFHLGAALERIAVAATEGSEGALKLREAAWLLQRYATLLEERPIGADLHVSSARLARTAETIAGLRELAADLEPTDAMQSAVEPAADTDPAPPPMSGDASTEPMPSIEPVAPSQIVYELPSIKRELFVTAMRTMIMVVSIAALVLLLTLIAQWR